MRRYLYLAISTSLAVAACSGIEADMTNQRPEQVGREPQAVLRRIVNAGSGLMSLKEVTVITATAAEGGHLRDEVTTTELIRTKDGRYVKSSDADGTFEELLVGDRRYYRESAAHQWSRGSPWSEQTANYVYHGDLELISPTYRFDFGILSNVQVDASEAGLLRLSGSFRKPILSPNTPGISALTGGSSVADSYSGVVSLLVDSASFFVHRLEVRTFFYRGHDEVAHHYRTSQFSDFNEPLAVPSALLD